MGERRVLILSRMQVYGYELVRGQGTAYYHAVDYPHTLRLGGICSCSLDSWLYNFYTRASFLTGLGSRTWTSGPLQRCDR
ncbi:hypothetical protein Taro_040102 [Colocasia esculenta]|uniref:Uncharacterized protein n=1 Tax=Colocasia esculenta TaxID=4460 RepID=A0A843WS23_COLES|nr:hypothetical protein [Colocasia esculenta]